MTKKDLKSGSIVELRNKERYLVLENTLLDLKCLGAFLRLSSYTNTLYYGDTSTTSPWDIMKVNNNVVVDELYNNAITEVYWNEKPHWTWTRPKELKKPTKADLNMVQTLLTLYPKLSFIARDEDGDLCGFIEEPKLVVGMWVNKKGGNDYDLSGLNKMFLFIREDSEKAWSLQELKGMVG